MSPRGRPAVGGPPGGTPIDVLHTRCAGLDVHKKTVVACILRTGPDGREERQVRSFGTTTAGLLELADRLAESGVTHAAIESTGVYWKPVWHLLEDRLELMLVNARHIKQVPGRKTDVKDAEWIAQLLRYGLLRPAGADPRAARPDAAADPVGARSRHGDQPDREGAGGR